MSVKNNAMNMNLRWSAVCTKILLLNFIGIGLGSAFSDLSVKLLAPRYVTRHHNAYISCENNVDNDNLDKVTFYKDGMRLAYYEPDRTPDYVIFNNTVEANITITPANPTNIQLFHMEFRDSGTYACEVAIKKPLYSKLSNFQEVTVIHKQKHRPKMKIHARRYYSQEVLTASCQSLPAHPAPHVTWYINDMKVGESYTTPNGVHKLKYQDWYLSTTNVSLNYPLRLVRLIENETIDVTCLSTIPSYPSVNGFVDVQKQTVKIKVINVSPPAPTQLPVVLEPSVSTLSSGQETSEKSSAFCFAIIICIFYDLLEF